MSREFRFRYWDAIHQEFIQECDVYLCADGEILVGDFNNPPIVRVGDSVIPSQYTGLKDKHGNRIFEGDILEVKTFGFDSETFITDVLFEEAQFKFRKRRSLFYFGQKDLSILDDAVILGNIFQNPELLEEIK